MQLTETFTKWKIILPIAINIILAIITAKIIVDSSLLLAGLLVGVIIIILSLYFKKYIPAFLFIYFSGLSLFYTATSSKQLPLTTVFVGFLAFITLLQIFIQNREPKLKSISLILLYIIFVIVSSLYNGVLLWEFKSYFAPILTAIYLIILLQSQEKLKMLNFLAKVIIIYGIVNAVVAVFQFSGIEVVSPATEKLLNVDDRIRAYGLLGHPTKMGQYFALAFGIAIGQIILAKERRKKILLMIVLTIIFIGLIMTLSRGAIGGSLVASAVTVIYLKFKGNIKLLKYLFIVLVLFIVIQAVFPTNFLTDYITRDDSSTQLRKSLNKIAIEIFKEHPVFGVGIGQYTELSPSYGLGGEFEPHNTYLGILAEYGILGILAFSAILFLSLKGFKNVIGQNNVQKEKIISIYLGFFVAFIAILIDGVFHSFEYSYMLWFMIAVGLSYEEV